MSGDPLRIYFDSDVLIWHLRGDSQAKTLFRSAQSEPGADLWVGALQRAEVTFFMRPKEEALTLSFLSLFKTAPVTQEIVDQGGTLFRKWRKSHGTDVNDAILAATVIQTGGKLFTLNMKHYPMPNLFVFKAW